MKTSHFTIPATVAGLLFFTVVAGCDSASTENDIGDLSSSVAEVGDLGLSTAQSAEISALFLDDAEPDPARSWAVAASLQQSLSDAQKEKFVSTDRTEKSSRHSARGRGTDEKSSARQHRGADDILTAEQKAAVETAREEQKLQVRELREQFENGSITNSELRERLSILRAEMRQQFDELLTEDQKAALQSRRSERAERRDERRTAAAAAMAEALDLTPDQIAAIEQLRASTRTSMQALHEEGRSGTSRDDLKERADEIREAARTTLESILSAEQLELHDLHRAVMASGKRSVRGGRDASRGNFRRGPWSQSGN